jgi:iron only hydrogenase large subunit-like protein
LRPVFIGPCLLKKLEASQDHPDLDILALTYQDLALILDYFRNRPLPVDELATFDLIGAPTRLYPISGGLSQSAGINNLFTDEEYDVVSGPEPIAKGLSRFSRQRKLKFLDILNCPGGCIHGPGINNQSLSTEERRRRVTAHWAKSVR